MLKVNSLGGFGSGGAVSYGPLEWTLHGSDEAGNGNMNFPAGMEDGDVAVMLCGGQNCQLTTLSGWETCITTNSTLDGFMAVRKVLASESGDLVPYTRGNATYSSGGLFVLRPNQPLGDIVASPQNAVQNISGQADSGYIDCANEDPPNLLLAYSGTFAITNPLFDDPALIRAVDCFSDGTYGHCFGYYGSDPETNVSRRARHSANYSSFSRAGIACVNFEPV